MSAPENGKSRSRWPWWIRLPFKFGVLLCFLGVIALIALVVVYGNLASEFKMADLGKMPERSFVYDSQGTTMGRLHGENRIKVRLEDVSPHFVEALLAREDNRFYEHPGVDPVGIARAVVRNVKDRDFVQGASTITMQLSRNSYGLTARTLHRKLVEVALAFRIELHTDKDKILEHYVNRIFFGTGIYGIERASQAYFGKPAKEMTLDEAAMVAGIIRGPNRFSPFRNPEGAVEERDVVLDRMVQLGRLSAEKAKEAKLVTTKVLSPSRQTFQESYALDAVRRELNEILDAEDVEDGGLRIHTTLDSRLQVLSEQSLEARLAEAEKTRGFQHQTRAGFAASSGPAEDQAPSYLQGALVVIDNATGGILAVVGGRDFGHSKYNRAWDSRRQVGSTFKPFVYAMGVRQGLFPRTLVDDSPIQPGQVTDGGNWSPRNSDGKFIGMQPAEVGLIRSRNTMTVRIGEIATMDRVIDMIDKLALTRQVKRSPQLYIGNFGTTLRDLTAAYTVFPNGGLKRQQFIIDRIETTEGEVVYQSGKFTFPIMPASVAHMTHQMMGKVMDKGTGQSARRMGFKSPAGGKTGTTNDYHDAWFVGYTQGITCGTWVGLDQPKRIMDGGYGSKLALPIWTDVMKVAEKLGYKAEAPRALPATQKVELCVISGQQANASCKRSKHSYTADIPIDLIPQTACSRHRGWLSKPPLKARRPGEQAPPRARRPNLFDKIKKIFK